MSSTPVVRQPHTTPVAGASGLAAAITRRWVALYTHGVNPEAAYRRRTEVECDLWEQHNETHVAGTPPVRLAIDVVGRLLRGLPADIAWRSRMEGSFVSINIPANRVVGLLFLFTVILTFIATSLSRPASPAMTPQPRAGKAKCAALPT